MTKPAISPFSSLIHFLGVVFQGRVRFPRELVGTMITLDDGEWLVLREMLIAPETESPHPPLWMGKTPIHKGGNEKQCVVFRPRFHVKGMSPKVNEWFSWLPIPFFAGLPGFRRKLWLLDPISGDSSGYYEWQTLDDANAYAHSFAMRFMTRRSVPGSVSARVIPRD